MGGTQIECGFTQSLVVRLRGKSERGVSVYRESDEAERGSHRTPALLFVGSVAFRLGMTCGDHGQCLNADRSFRRTPCPSGDKPYHRDGHGVGRRMGKLAYQPSCCAVQPHAPTEIDRPIVGAWGAANTDSVSPPIDRSAARRARLGICLTIGDGHGVGRRMGKLAYQPSCCAVQPHAPTIGCPNPIAGHGVGRHRVRSRETICMLSARCCRIASCFVASLQGDALASPH
jgi:hypothetical protein